MAEGFFSASRLVSKAPPSMLPRCGLCGLKGTCKSPLMPVSGEGRRRILIVGEAPGAEEDKNNLQFVGKTGRRLESELANLGCDMRRDCWLTNSLVCRPPDNEIKNGKMIEWCRPNLLNTLQKLDPEVIILLGSHAVTSMIGHVWKDDPGGIMRWAGFRIPCQRPNAWICPTYHPSFVERADEEKKPVPGMHWKRHLAAALELSGRPWQTVPDYKSQVKRIYDDEEKARQAIVMMMAFGKPVAWDYETNCLKPETPGGCIVSVSLSNGTDTVAFPWRGEKVKKQMQTFLKSSIKKIGSNIKFEERWTWHEFGHGVDSWWIDTMNKAHVLDCRPGITGVKFQAFARLGAEAYDDHVRPFLESKRGQKINRILEEIDLDDLLLYNGMDSLLEWLVARDQVKEEGGSW
jgi:uracil-DNA glycosylase family 4